MKSIQAFLCCWVGQMNVNKGLDKENIRKSIIRISISYVVGVEFVLRIPISMIYEEFSLFDQGRIRTGKCGT